MSVPQGERGETKLAVIEGVLNLSRLDEERA
jgi:hypothetical protein